jgi:hypothetical protein
VRARTLQTHPGLPDPEWRDTEEEARQRTQAEQDASDRKIARHMGASPVSREQIARISRDSDEYSNDGYSDGVNDEDDEDDEATASAYDA